ncbi:MAG TPA: GNAT family N-acetyltransferase [Methanothrix sp.]|nr:GNAT family N-acetyltransferase [Methanothrix sp.]
MINRSFMDIFMQAAIDEALEGLKEGGVPIGAVLVENGRIIGRGRNRRVQDSDQLMHAEIDCLHNSRLTGGYHNTTLYSTLMPCYLCAGAVVQFGIKKVVVGEEKSAPAARDFMLSHGIEVVNLEIAQCREMMERFMSNNRELWDGFLAELNPDLLKPSDPSISIRHHLLPGDVGYITYLHASLHALPQGWDHTFDSYVAIPLAQFALRSSPQERIWIAEREGQIVGCVAIVKFSDEEAQLRWLLLLPEVREKGYGRRLVEAALQFSLEAGYSSVFLWTVSTLPAAAGLYRSMGFEERERLTHVIWGREVTEVKYEWAAKK